MTADNDKDMLKNLKVSFAKMSASPENLSDFLSIMGANANLRRIEPSTAVETEEVFGYVGHGLLDTVMARSKIIDNTQFVKLDEVKNGEIAACLLNVVYPKAFSKDTSGGLDLTKGLRTNKSLFVKAAFAQHFISTKEGLVPLGAYDSMFHLFAFVERDGRMVLIQGGFCYDATAYFKKHVWSTDEDGKRKADFSHLLDSAPFSTRDGHIYAVVADNKLMMAKQLHQLQELYGEKYGKFENDKSMSAEDWADMSSLNATINEAEEFELSVEGEQSPKKKQPNANASSISIDERRELFQQIDRLEKKLWLEQERFDYAIIPGEDVKQAKVTFYEQLAADSDRDGVRKSSKKTMEKRGPSRRLRTPFKEISAENVTSTKSATPKQTKKRPLKWFSDPRPAPFPRETPKRRRV